MYENNVKRWSDREYEFLYMPEQYFCGTDCAVYIGDKEIVDISGIEFQLRQQLKPIYGYKSYTFDKMAVGNRIVIGSFRIPFIKKNFLRNLIRPTISSTKGKDDQVNLDISQGEQEMLRGYLDRRFGVAKDTKANQDKVPERKYNAAYTGEGFTAEESKILKKKGFNIYVAYGTHTADEIAENYKTQKFSFENNIDTILNKGVNVIEGVFLRGHSQLVTVDDTIYEVYEFIAKDIY